jgi:hypothetical protein
MIKVHVEFSFNNCCGLGSMEYWASIVTLTGGTARGAELSALCAIHTLTPREVLEIHFF